MNVDAKEQGLVIRLPVKVGDTIYRIPNEIRYKYNIIKKNFENNRVYCQTVDGIEITKHDIFIENEHGMNCVRLETLGTYWFLKQEEAEQKLKEMEKKYDSEK